MNLNHEPVKLYKNTAAATYEPVEIKKQEKVNTLSADTTTSEHSCAYIDELIQQNTSNLNESQIKCLRALLYEYKDQFSISSYDLGHTNLVEHTIKSLPDCKPVKLRPYRILLIKRAFAENEIKCMAEKGLIEPPHSAWSAP